MTNLLNKYIDFIDLNSFSFKRFWSTWIIENHKMINWCKEHDFINCSIGIDIKDSKYLSFYDLIDNFKDYQSRFIKQDMTLMTMDDLKKEIQNNYCVYISNQVRKIHEELIDQQQDLTLQRHVINNVENLYCKNLLFDAHNTDEYPLNFSSLISSDSSSIMDSLIDSNNSFIVSYFIRTLITEYLKEHFSFREDLGFNLSEASDNSFDLETSYNQNKVNIKRDFIQIILKNQYNIINKSDDFFENGILIDADIDEAFDNLFQSHHMNLAADLAKNIKDVRAEGVVLLNQYTQILYGYISFNFIQDIDFIDFNNLSKQIFQKYNQIFEDPTQSSQNNLKYLEERISSITYTLLESNTLLREYFYILFQHRFDLKKFVNIINYVISSYVFHNIRFKDVFQFNEPRHLKELFDMIVSNFTSNISNSSFESNFNKKLENTNISNMLSTNSGKLNKDIIKHSFILLYYNNIHNYIKSSNCDDDIKYITKKIYTYLRRTNNIKSDVDHTDCLKPMKIYLNSLLRSFIKDDTLFDVDSFHDFTLDYINESSLMYFNLSTKITDNNRTIRVSEDYLFNIFIRNFIDSKSHMMFNFIKNFITSVNAKVYSDSVHYAFKHPRKYQEL